MIKVKIKIKSGTQRVQRRRKVSQEKTINKSVIVKEVLLRQSHYIAEIMK